jgi:hypothetical protein
MTGYFTTATCLGTTSPGPKLGSARSFRVARHARARRFMTIGHRRSDSSTRLILARRRNARPLRHDSARVNQPKTVPDIGLDEEKAVPTENGVKPIELIRAFKETRSVKVPALCFG